MSQHDYILSNDTGANFRADLNNALAAIATANSGATAPTTTYANQVWYDTTLGILKIRNPSNTDWLSFQPLIRGTSQSPASVACDFTGIPNGTRRITIMLYNISTSGTSNMLVQLGTSSGFVTSGYTSSCNQFSGSPGSSTSSAGFLIQEAVSSSAFTNGQVVLTNIDGNNWVYSSNLSDSQPTNAIGAGRRSLTAVLDRVRITMVNGTDTFQSGSINILYE